MELTREKMALIVVDMQNGFCHDDGSLGKLDLDVGLLKAAVPGCVRLVEAARSAGVPVIFTRYVYRADYADGGVLVKEIMPALAEINSLAQGTWDAELVDELRPREGDEVIDKNRYSSFYGTRLEPYLTSLGIESLVVCGVTTNMCVETTVRDASQRDYKVFVVSDATGELEASRHEHALYTMGFGFGKVVTVEDVVDAWTREPARVG
jgi:ureidoacrylate peracid hydrolase